MKKLLLLLLLALHSSLFTFCYAQTGTWTKLTNAAPAENMGVCLLLTNGTVMCHDTIGGTYGTGWNLLTPDINGSYVNGTWTTLASMANDRLFFSTQILPTGKVYVAGGEYGAGTNQGEVYNPATNTWTACGAIPNTWKIYDGNSELLYTGNVLEGPQIGSSSSFNILQWSPTTLNYTTEANAPLNHDEAEWLKLPDSTVLYIGIASQNSCRFLPKTNTWLTDGTVPDKLYDQYGEEAGCAFMLPNGKAVFFGATQHNAIYTPTGHATAGTWAAAADFPTINGTPVGQTDASGAMMVNGHILLACSPVGTSSNNEFNTPVYFVEYNYVTNTFTQVKSTIPGIGGDSIPYGNSCFQTQMLTLPDGNILVSLSQSGTLSTTYWEYTPGSAAIPQGKPTINSIYQTNCTSYEITGKLFNGISEGAAYGDDWQMSTNWPIVRLTSGSGNVYYATTSNWNRLGAVQTDSLEDTAQFVLPASIPEGTYSLVVVVNGFASNPTLFSTYNITGITATANVSCFGGNNGNATATVQGGETPYTYKWVNGSSTVSTSNPTGPVLTAGTYTLTVTDKPGCTTTASIVITQPAKLTVSVSVTQNVSCFGGNNGSATLTTSGGTSPYTYLWSDASSQTTSTASGLTVGTYTISVTDNNGCTATNSTIITQPASALAITMSSQTNILCNGGVGSATANAATGGTSPYIYSWTSGGGTNLTASNLSAGSYTIIATDNNGCVATASVDITQPNLLVVSPIVNANIKCSGGNNGTDSAATSGGTLPYTYQWSDANSQTTITASGLFAGTYTITVKDSNGCSATASSIITQPNMLTNSDSVINENCNGSNTASISSSPSGGTSPYTYLWSGGGTNSSKTGLTVGTYTLTITDSYGCSTTSSSIVTQPTALIVKTDSINVTSSGTGCNGEAQVTVSGATSPYTYSWTPGGGTNDTVNGKCAGTYCCTITDNNGCTEKVCITIKSTVGIDNIGGTSSDINIYPDPNNGNFTVQWVGTQNFVSERWSVEIYNVTGEKIYNQLNIHNSTFNIDLSNKSNGVYLVKILDKNGSLVAQRKIIKTE